MRFLAALLFVAVTATVGVVSCVKTNAFQCDGDNSACGAGGLCEADGFCSVASDRCGGREYSDTAGDLAGKCIGGDPPTDGMSPDGLPPDGMPPDGPAVACAAGYTTITNGQANHKYKLIATQDEWSNQHNLQCVTSGGYLAIPDSATELTAIATLAAAESWVGVTDGPGNGQETMFNDVLNVAYDAMVRVGLTISANAQNKDCVTAPAAGTALVADSCTQTFVAVCECDE